MAVDVAVDQGGCFETTKATTHSDPVYTVDGVIHYCVANMPGAVARTSTFALTNSTLRYALQLADKGLKQAVAENRAPGRGRQHLRRQADLPGRRGGAGAALHAARAGPRLAAHGRRPGRIPGNLPARRAYLGEGAAGPAR